MQELIIDIITRIWLTYTETHVELNSSSQYDELFSDQSDIASAVTLTGEEAYIVVVVMAPAVAANFMAKMTGMEMQEIGDYERDAMANELANLIGGNLKPHILGRCALGLPEKIESQNQRDALFRNRLDHHVAFDTPYGQFQAAMIKINKR